VTDTHPPKKSLSKFLIVIGLVSFVLLLLGIAVLLEAWHVEESNKFAMNWLVNLGAGFLGMAAATLVATATGWFLARQKLKDLAVPMLRLIQELRFKSQISPEAARRAVVCAVTLMPEGSVSSSKLRRKESALQKCPVCFLDIDPGTDLKKQCSFCLLPGAVWSYEDLVKDPAASAETAS
jgi:hypothetical protein